MSDRILFELHKDNKITSPAYDLRIEDIEKDQSRFWGIFSCMSERIDGLEKKLESHERMIEILMEMVNEQRDTIQLIRYAFED